MSIKITEIFYKETRINAERRWRKNKRKHIVKIYKLPLKCYPMHCRGYIFKRYKIVKKRKSYNKFSILNFLNTDNREVYDV